MLCLRPLSRCCRTTLAQPASALMRASPRPPRATGSLSTACPMARLHSLMTPRWAIRHMVLDGCWVPGLHSQHLMSQHLPHQRLKTRLPPPQHLLSHGLKHTSSPRNGAFSWSSTVSCGTAVFTVQSGCLFHAKDSKTRCSVYLGSALLRLHCLCSHSLDFQVALLGCASICCT